MYKPKVLEKLDALERVFGYSRTRVADTLGITMGTLLKYRANPDIVRTYTLRHLDEVLLGGLHKKADEVDACLRDLYGERSEGYRLSYPAVTSLLKALRTHPDKMAYIDLINDLKKYRDEQYPTLSAEAGE